MIFAHKKNNAGRSQKIKQLMADFVINQIRRIKLLFALLDTTESLLRRADAALYQAKSAGRNRVVAA